MPLKTFLTFGQFLLLAANLVLSTGTFVWVVSESLKTPICAPPASIEDLLGRRIQAKR